MSDPLRNKDDKLLPRDLPWDAMWCRSTQPSDLAATAESCWGTRGSVSLDTQIHG